MAAVAATPHVKTPGKLVSSIAAAARKDGLHIKRTYAVLDLSSLFVGS